MTWTNPYFGISHLLNTVKGVYVSITTWNTFTTGYVLDYRQSDQNNGTPERFEAIKFGKNSAEKTKRVLENEAKNRAGLQIYKG